MEPDQQKEGEAEQLSGTRDVSQHQALKQKKGRRERGRGRDREGGKKRER